MTIESSDELVFESPDGGNTVYARKVGETARTLHYVDPVWQKEQELTSRWKNLRGAVFLDDVTINDAISKVEMLYVLKKK